MRYAARKKPAASGRRFPSRTRQSRSRVLFQCRTKVAGDYSLVSDYESDAAVRAAAFFARLAA